MRRRGIALSLAALVAAALTQLTLVGAPVADALPNTLANTPPMGWNDWNAFGCGVDEQLVTQTADTLVSNGMRDAGYTYVNIDDCWMARNRDGNGNLVPDPVKFPHGITAVADYVHARGLKLGIYESAGTLTCQSYPGSLGHETQDAALFASWQVDYLKYDNCNNQGVSATQRYTAMRDALRATGRTIGYSICNWGEAGPWNWGPATGNLWRTTGDISDNWGSVASIFGQNAPLYQHAAPGAWNDPDMLEVGNGGMTDTEYRTHFSLWAEMAAPLIAGTDLRKASAATLAIYLNQDVIGVDQDSLGAQGHVIATGGSTSVLTKPLANGDAAVLLVNTGGAAATIATTAAAAGVAPAASYGLRDLWSHQNGSTTGSISATVPAHGAAMYRVSGGGSAVSAPYRTYSSGGQAGFAQSADHLTLSGSGADAWTGVDQYQATYQAGVFGDGSSTTVRLTAQQPTDPWAKAGIMVRNSISSAGSSPGYVVLAATPEHGYVLQWDSDGNGYLDSTSASVGSAAYPSWLRLSRSGNTYTGAYSADGSTWVTVGSATVPGAAAGQDAGFFATSHQAGVVGRAAFATDYRPTGAITGIGGKCVDVTGGGNTSGTQLELWTCNQQSNQTWTASADGTIQSMGKCMDVAWAGTANGAAVQLWDCNGGANQQWQPQSNGTLLNPVSGRCLDASGGGSADGTKLIIFDCSGNPNQLWRLPG
ncbi:hypothetical protein F0L68_02140 [Solihabitans fulvus]|uniref:Alpha-galactosidase n=1 Tax=Solihabitans fulvus TaxID=1892852 RepID=A0A5B2XUK0_9PSEU|nr:ricin-type beta-trefoil lectin domain protein [Solihabitans fulvus]KAA2266559.1 hypothetical protein F0L68_02140 [Solihabitans fulvus]